MALTKATNRMIEGAKINVRDFGAVGDGVLGSVAFSAATHNGGQASNYPYQITTKVSGTNDTAAFISAVESLNDGESLYIPKGIYCLENSDLTDFLVTLTSKKNITIYGDGDGSKLFTYHDTTTASFGLIDFQGCENITIRDINVEIQAIGHSDYDVNGQLSWARAFMFSPIGGGNAYSLGAVTANQTSSNCHVRDCSFRINHPGGSYPGDPGASGLSGGTKMGGILFYGDYAPPAAIGDEPDTNLALVSNCSLTSCTFNETQARTIWGWMTTGLIIKDNVFKRAGGTRPSIRLLHLNDKVIVDGNVVHCENDWGDVYHDCGINLNHNRGQYLNTEACITNNVVYVQRGAGIIANGILNSLISNNIIKKADGYTNLTYSNIFSGILMNWNSDDSGKGKIDNVIVSNNVISRTVGGIQGSGFTNVMFTNNNISNLSSSNGLGKGIYISTVDNVVVSGNTISNPEVSGIYIANSGVWPYGGTVKVDNNLVIGATGRGIDWSQGSTNFESLIISNNVTKDNAVGYRAGAIAINNVSDGDTAVSSDNTNAVLETLLDGKVGYSTYSLGIERGSNANGEYVKYADGTLINTGSITAPAQTGLSAKGALYSSSWASTTFPIAFLNTDFSVDISNPDILGGNYVIPTTVSSTSASTLYMSVLTYQNSIPEVVFQYKAIGRWK